METSEHSRVLSSSMYSAISKCISIQIYFRSKCVIHCIVSERNNFLLLCNLVTVEDGLEVVRTLYMLNKTGTNTVVGQSNWIGGVAVFGGGDGGPMSMPIFLLPQLR